jgi:hypothetical protein
MWIPGGVAYLVAALSLLALSLRDSESRVRAREALAAELNVVHWSAT